MKLRKFFMEKERKLIQDGKIDWKEDLKLLVGSS
jgi:hypothetical protein